MQEKNQNKTKCLSKIHSVFIILKGQSSPTPTIKIVFGLNPISEFFTSAVQLGLSAAEPACGPGFLLTEVA